MKRLSAAKSPYRVPAVRPALRVAERGEASDGETAALCAGGVVGKRRYWRRCGGGWGWRRVGNRGGKGGGTVASAAAGPLRAVLARAMASVAATSHRELPAPAADAATVDPGPRQTAFRLAGVSAAGAPVVEAPLPDAGPTPPPETHERL